MHAAKIASILLLPAFPASAAVVATLFPVTAYNANTATMNATLGISAYSIETFESTSLLPGLSITVSGGVLATTFSGTLPNLFDQSFCGSLSANSVWDGTHGLVNTPTNTLSNCNSPASVSSLVTVSYVSGAGSIGIGLGNFQSLNSPEFPVTNHELLVNGQDLGTIETLAGLNWTAGLSRNAYLRIDGTAGTVISSVAIQNLTGTDVLILDHIAVSPVPELPSVLSFTVGMAILFGLGRSVRNSRPGS
jgi:hypothetical protein